MVCSNVVELKYMCISSLRSFTVCSNLVEGWGTFYLSEELPADLEFSPAARGVCCAPKSFGGASYFHSELGYFSERNWSISEYSMSPVVLLLRERAIQTNNSTSLKADTVIQQH
jgi:hypothetical protein